MQALVEHQGVYVGALVLRVITDVLSAAGSWGISSAGLRIEAEFPA